MNPEYEKSANEAFLNLENWVHHIPYILPQGRVVWQNPYPKPEGADEQDEENENGEEKEEWPVAEPEAGPELLTSIAQDEGERYILRDFLIVCE
jgi:radial spoke head protein 4/6